LGKISITAGIASPHASANPRSRSGIADAGAGTITGRMYMSSAAAAPAARYPLRTPANRITKPTAAITPAASTASCEHSVPSGISTKPTPVSPRYANRRAAGGPPKSAKTSIAVAPNTANSAV
jgi:hypothetical protein